MAHTPLILAAMPEEENALLEELGGAQAFELTTLDTRLGLSVREPRNKPHKHDFLIARSGIGPVNAALTAALITEARPKIDAIVLLGVGGALAPELRIGELVISSEVLQHDSFSSLDFVSPRMLAVHFILNEKDAAAHRPAIQADRGLAAWLQSAVPHAHLGAVLSGSEFVGTVARKRAIADLHERALLVDMEAAGVAQVATRLGIPFVVAKTVADRLCPDGSIESDFRACLDAAARNAASVLRRLLLES
jgi:adenosylhomocysteine nucleosidase